MRLPVVSTADGQRYRLCGVSSVTDSTKTRREDQDQPARRTQARRASPGRRADAHRRSRPPTGVGACLMRARDDARRNVTSAREAAQDADYAPLVAQLCVLRGIDVLSAMMILTELGDLRRFGSAHQVMAAVGLVPIEYSTGASAGVHRVGNRSIGGKGAHDRRSLR